MFTAHCIRPFSLFPSQKVLCSWCKLMKFLRGPNPCLTVCIQHLECPLCAEPLPGLNPSPSEAGVGLRKNQGVKVVPSSVSAITSGLWP